MKNSEEEYPETVAELKKNVYVDDVISGGENEEQLRKFREEAIALFKAGGFTLHKWHSTIATLEDQSQPDGYQTYAKEALGTTPLESKLLGLHWNKTVDTLAVNFEECKKTNELTKRGVLRAMAKVYDPLGIASPIMLNAKHIYRQICEENHSWDGALRKEIELAWKQWLYNLPNEVTVPRSLTSVHEKITGVYLHAFGDASKKGCCAAIYAVVQQGDKQVQELLASKSQIAKKNTGIPRLELVSAHMAVNLVDNIRTALAGYNIIGTYIWLDSAVALYWIINNDGNWKQFVSNRLGLSTDDEGLLRCRGRIIGEQPLYLPSKHAFTKLVVEDAHLKTLHGGVALTMAKVREKWWIEKLRSLVKGVLHKCAKCKRYRCKPLPAPPTAALPEFRTEGSRAFQTVGVDFAGPLEYKVSKKIKAKSYVALYTCATTRAVHLDLLTDMTAEEFKRSLTEFIAKRGNPIKMVSDNGKTFVTTAKWLNKLRRNQLLNDYLAKMNIRWQFNMARSPWWGGFFERMVGLMKSALRKVLWDMQI